MTIQRGEERLRRQSGQLALVTGVMTSLVIGLMLFTIFLNMRGAASGALPGGAVEAAVKSLIYWLPGFLHLWGLWSIWRVFRNIAKGDLFGPVIGKGLAHLGLAVAAGGAASALAVPNLLRWSIEAGLVSGRTAPFQGVLHFDMAYLMLVLLGGAILLLGRLIGRAAEYQSDSEKLRSELDEFF